MNKLYQYNLDRLEQLAAIQQDDTLKQMFSDFRRQVEDHQHYLTTEWKPRYIDTVTLSTVQSQKKLADFFLGDNAPNNDNVVEFEGK